MSGNNGQGDTSDFDDFVASGEVEVGESNLAAPEKEPKAAPVEDDPDGGETSAEGDEDGGNADDQDGDEEADDQKKEGNLKRLKRERMEAKREARELKAKLAALENGGLLQRLEALEKSGLPNNLNGGTSQNQGKPAPDPTDTDNYPLGHLDDRYIEDKLEWLAEKKATERADAVLQRQQENERNTQVQRDQQVLLDKVDDLATRGSEISDDFQELVVEAGMRGDWDLSQTTFEAAHDSENGAAILLELAQNPKEAARVAKLSHLGQLKYVQERDAEIGKGKQPRRVPRAGEPPQNTARGANSRTQINPATDNLDDFEKAWEQDAKRGNR